MADSQEQLSTGNGSPRDSSSHLYKTFVWQKRCLWSLVFAYLVSIPIALLGFVIGLFCFGLAKALKKLLPAHSIKQVRVVIG